MDSTRVTVALDEELVTRAQVRAAELGLSLSGFLARLLREDWGLPPSGTADPEYEQAKKRFFSGKPLALREPGERLPTRDEIHDRPRLP